MKAKLSGLSGQRKSESLQDTKGSRRAAILFQKKCEDFLSQPPVRLFGSHDL